MKQMTIPTKTEILSALSDTYQNDLPFIEMVNNFTYGQKVNLKRERNTILTKPNNNGNNQNTTSV